jgi:hypothetical protein
MPSVLVTLHGVPEMIDVARLFVDHGRALTADGERINTAIKNRRDDHILVNTSDHDWSGTAILDSKFQLDGPNLCYVGVNQPLVLAAFEEGRLEGNAALWRENGDPRFIAPYRRGRIEGRVWLCEARKPIAALDVDGSQIVRAWAINAELQGRELTPEELAADEPGYGETLAEAERDLKRLTSELRARARTELKRSPASR